jgi:hypothetical protein
MFCSTRTETSKLASSAGLAYFWVNDWAFMSKLVCCMCTLDSVTENNALAIATHLICLQLPHKFGSLKFQIYKDDEFASTFTGQMGRIVCSNSKRERQYLAGAPIGATCEKA